MRFSELPILMVVALVASCAATPAPTPTPDPATIPADILARQTCQDDIILESNISIANDLAAAFKQYGGLGAAVIVSYDLDGSGSAVNSKVIYANPKKLFDRIVLRQLDHTEFAPGITRASCTYVRTFTRRPVKTETTITPIGLMP